MILQDPAGALNPRHTVYESVAEGLRLHKMALPDPDGRSEEQQVADALSSAGLRPPERLFLRYPHELSGGQRQRVLIAGALALRPGAADRRRAGLQPGRLDPRGDPGAAAQARGPTSGSGVLVVTHDLGLAWNIADRTAVMYLGRIVEAGPTEDVLAAPQHPYTQALLSVVPGDRAARAGGADGRDPRPEPHPARVPVPPALPGAGRRAGRPRPGSTPPAGRRRWRCCPPARATALPVTWWPHEEVTPA